LPDSCSRTTGSETRRHTSGLGFFREGSITCHSHTVGFIGCSFRRSKDASQTFCRGDCSSPVPASCIPGSTADGSEAESGKGSLRIAAGHTFTEDTECLTIRFADTASRHPSNCALQLHSGGNLFSLWQFVRNASGTAVALWQFVRDASGTTDILRRLTCRIRSGSILPGSCSAGTLPLWTRPSCWFG